MSHAHGHGWESSRVRGPVGHSCLRVTTSERFFNLGSGAPASAVDHHNACHLPPNKPGTHLRMHVKRLGRWMSIAAISSACQSAHALKLTRMLCIRSTLCLAAVHNRTVLA